MGRITLLAGYSLAALAFSSVLHAQSSRKVYDYDALGRLVEVCNHSDPNAFAEERDYRYDAGGNRTRVSSLDNTWSLSTGEQWFSENSQFRFIMQDDGNLVLYQGGTALWASHTVGSGATRAIMQADGNLALRSSSYTPVWSTGTRNNHCARLRIQDDGNVVIYSKNGAPLWATGTSIAP